jgi:hypothetical protein
MVANIHRPHSHYLDYNRKLPADIRGMVERIHALTGDASFGIRLHAPGGGKAYYSMVKVDTSTPCGYAESARRQSFTGLGHLRIALSGYLAALEEKLMIATVVCLHWQGRNDRESQSTGKIMVNGQPLCYKDGAQVPALYDGCHHRTDHGDVRRILTARGYSALIDIDVIAIPVARKGDLYGDSAPLWSIMDKINGE